MFQERRWADMPNVTFTFDCTDRSIGFYADLEFDCMVSYLKAKFLFRKSWSIKIFCNQWIMCLSRYSIFVMRMEDEFRTCAQMKPVLTRNTASVTGITTWTAQLLRTGKGCHCYQFYITNGVESPHVILNIYKWNSLCF